MGGSSNLPSYQGLGFDYVNTVLRDTGVQHHQQKEEFFLTATPITLRKKKKKKVAASTLSPSGELYSSRRGFVDSRCSSRLLHELKEAALLESEAAERGGGAGTALIKGEGGKEGASPKQLSRQLSVVPRGETALSPGRAGRSPKGSPKGSPRGKTPTFLIPANDAIHSLTAPHSLSRAARGREDRDRPSTSSSPRRKKFINPYATNLKRWGPRGREGSRSGFLSGRMVGGQPTETFNDAQYGGLANMVLSAAGGPEIRAKKLLSYRPSWGTANRFMGSGEEICAPGPKYREEELFDSKVSGSSSYSFGTEAPHRDLFMRGFQHNGNNFEIDSAGGSEVGPASYSPMDAVPKSSQKPHHPEQVWSRSGVVRFAPRQSEKWRSPGPQYYPHVHPKKSMPKYSIGHSLGPRHTLAQKNHMHPKLEKKRRYKQPNAKSKNTSGKDETKEPEKSREPQLTPAQKRKAKIDALVAGKSVIHRNSDRKTRVLEKLQREAGIATTSLEESQKIRKGQKPFSPSMFKRRDPSSQYIGTHMLKAGGEGPGPIYHSPVNWSSKKAKHEQFIPAPQGWK